MKILNKFTFVPAFLAIGIVAGIVVPIVNKAPAQTSKSIDLNRCEIVILHSFQDGDGTGYHGIKVYASSSSSNAPTFPQATFPQVEDLIETSEAFAQLRSRGYQILRMSDNGLDAVFEKTR